MHRPGARLVLLVLTALALALGLAAPSFAASPNVVISQVYGGGGNTGATYKNDFIELYNRSASPVSLAGWSIQYASATGTTWQVTNLSGTIAAGGYYLVQEAAGTGGTTSLPTPDATGTIAMSGTAGKVVLVNTTTAQSGAAPSGAQVIDLVGFGTTANGFEGTGPAPAPSNTTAIFRAAGGATDTDSNPADFSTGAPNPRNSATGGGGGGDAAPAVSSTSPANAASGFAAAGNLSVTFSEPVTASAASFTISCATSGAHAFTLAGGPTAWTLDPTVDFTAAESCTLTVVAAQVSDVDAIDPPDTMAANVVVTFTVASPPLAIHAIQGAAHLSPRLGQTVSTQGIVTGVKSNGFWIQEPDATVDADPATSEGIFVFTSSAPSAAATVGNLVGVTGVVAEFQPGGSTSGNLKTTELTSPVVSLISTGNPLPAPTVVGAGGRAVPSIVIEDDASGSVETTGTFDPATDGIDFWESLEGMRVQLNNAVAVGPTNSFGELPVVGDNGASASLRTPRGGLIIQPNDYNPELVTLDDAFLTMPQLNVGDTLPGATVGILDYNFGLFMLEAQTLPARQDNGLQQEVTATPGSDELAVATFNVENLDPNDGAAKFSLLAGMLVTNLKAPDIVVLEEIQDNNGATSNGVVDATTTLTMLRDAVVAAGGPVYSWRLVDPVDGQDGGEPGGNIRVAFFFRTDRGVAFVDRPGAGSLTPNAVLGAGAATQLQYSPGRIDPTNTAFSTSRKPLAGEFTFRGQTLFVIGNHWNSKGGDQPLWGVTQPPVRSSEVQRNQQATVVNAFVKSLEAANPQAQILLLGDLNDFQFSTAVATLTAGTTLVPLMNTLPANERYSYVFNGNSQTLDHIVASAATLARPYAYDVVHVNAEFANQASDHDPQVLRLTIPAVAPGTPDTTLTTVPPSSTTSRSVTLAWTSSLPASTFECQLDGSAFAPCSSPRTYNGLALGLHSFAVRAAKNGLRDPQPATALWTVIPFSVAPTTTFTATPPATTTLRQASFAWTADQPGARFECALDAAAFAPCSSPRTYNGLALGSHTLRVRAIGATGLVEATPEAASWTIVP